MLDKDTVVAIGVIFTVVIGLLNLGYSFRHNRRASYVNSVTATRLKWIGDVRDNLSRFVALIYQCAVAAPTNELEREKIFQEMAHKRMLLRLQLAPEKSQWDSNFEQEIESLYRDVNSKNVTDIDTRLNALVSAGQKFLWEEWLKVKREAIHGDPYDRWLYRFQSWWKRFEAQHPLI